MGGGSSEEAVDAIVVPARRRPIVALIALCSLIFVIGVAAAVPMTDSSQVDAGGLAPGEGRDAAPGDQRRFAGEAMEPSTTTSTVHGGAPLPPVGAAAPRPVSSTGDSSDVQAPARNPTTTTAPVAPTTTTTAPLPDPWRTSAPAPLTARRGHEAVWTPSGMVVLGGDSGGGLTGAVYHPGDDSWSSTSPAPFPSGDWRHAAMGAAWDGSARVYVAARTAPTGGTLAAYDPVADAWTALTAPLPEGTSTGGVVAWTGSRLLVLGGSGDEPSEEGRVTLAYTPGAGWTRLPDAPFPVWDAADPRTHQAWTSDGLLVWDDSATGALLRRSDDGTWSWSTVPAAPFDAPLDRATVTWTGRHAVWLFGEDGAGGQPVAGAAYDPEAGTWSSLAGGPLSGRAGHVAVRMQGETMFVCCGDAATGADAAAAFDASAGSWTALASHDGLAAHGDGASAVWTGSEVVVWGGGDGSSPAPATIFSP